MMAAVSLSLDTSELVRRLMRAEAAIRELQKAIADLQSVDIPLNTRLA